MYQQYLIEMRVLSMSMQCAEKPVCFPVYVGAWYKIAHILVRYPNTFPPQLKCLIIYLTILLTVKKL